MYEGKYLESLRKSIKMMEESYEKAKDEAPEEMLTLLETQINLLKVDLTRMEDEQLGRIEADEKQKEFTDSLSAMRMEPLDRTIEVRVKGEWIALHCNKELNIHSLPMRRLERTTDGTIVCEQEANLIIFPDGKVTTVECCPTPVSVVMPEGKGLHGCSNPPDVKPTLPPGVKPPKKEKKGKEGEVK